MKGYIYLSIDLHINIKCQTIILISSNTLKGSKANLLWNLT